jgi:hypothetical protein
MSQQRTEDYKIKNGTDRDLKTNIYNQIAKQKNQEHQGQIYHCIMEIIQGMDRIINRTQN